MNTTEKRKELSKLIQSRFGLMLVDVDTFIWLKLDNDAIYQQGVKDFGIGGGNFLSTLGLFSVIDLLASIYTILRRGKIPVSKKDNSLSGKTKRFFTRLLKNFNIIIPQFLKVSEDKDAIQPERFKRLVNDSSEGWGLSDEQLSKCWSYYRNPLVHTAFPRSMILTGKFEGIDKYSDFIDAKATVVPFGFDSNGNPFCNVELLLKNIEDIIEWLFVEVADEKKYPDNHIQKILEWLAKQ